MSTPKSNEERTLGALLAPDILVILDENPADVAVETEELHPADLADVAEALPRNRLRALFAALAPERAASVLEYLNEEVRAELLEAMPAEDAAELVEEMSPDDRADVLETLDEETAEEILDELEPEDRRETEALLAFEPDTAGGLMTTEFVSVRQELTVEAAVAEVRAIARGGRKEALYAIYAVDPAGHVTGVLSLKELLAAPEGARIEDVMWTDVRSVVVTADREEVARLTSEYDLVALPVVDSQRRLLGVVTVDDVIDVIQQEQTEDVQKLGGMEAIDEPYLDTSFGTMLRKRAGWLSILLVGEMLTASAMGFFEGELQKALVLSLFVPLIISSGGNSGSQATSLIIRALALREVRGRDWLRVASRELPTGFVLGLILGSLGAVRVLAWQWLGIYDHGAHYGLVALTVGLSLVGVVTFGSLAGSMLPFALRRVGFDPASASAPFVATLVDVTGLVIYFGVAVLILRGTLL
jgi:magnesium transporter